MTTIRLGGMDRPALATADRSRSGAWAQALVRQAGDHQGGQAVPDVGLNIDQGSPDAAEGDREACARNPHRGHRRRVAAGGRSAPATRCPPNRPVGHPPHHRARWPRWRSSRRSRACLAGVMASRGSPKPVPERVLTSQAMSVEPRAGRDRVRRPGSASLRASTCMPRDVGGEPPGSRRAARDRCGHRCEVGWSCPDPDGPHDGPRGAHPLPVDDTLGTATRG